MGAEGTLQYRECLVDLVVGDRERRDEPQHVLAGTARQHDQTLRQARLLHGLGDRRRPAAPRSSGPSPTDVEHAAELAVEPSGDGRAATTPSVGGPLVADPPRPARRAWPGRPRTPPGCLRTSSRACPVGHRSKTDRSAMRPPSGRPEATPFANRMTSGATPIRSAANGRPVRPMPALDLVEHEQDPVLRRSARRRPSQPGDGRRDVATLAQHRLHDHRRDRRAPGVCTCEQLVEARRGLGRRRGIATRRATGSGCGVRRDRDTDRAAARNRPGTCPWPWSATWRPAVRPWKPPRNATMPGRPVTRRASLMTPSTASAPVLQKNTWGSVEPRARAPRRSASSMFRSWWATTDVWISRPNCALAAATTAGGRWPTLVTPMPEVRSSQRRPSASIEPRTLAFDRDDLGDPAEGGGQRRLRRGRASPRWSCVRRGAGSASAHAVPSIVGRLSIWAFCSRPE